MEFLLLRPPVILKYYGLRNFPCQLFPSLVDADRRVYCNDVFFSGIVVFSAKLVLQALCWLQLAPGGRKKFHLKAFVDRLLTAL
jgi:hypothetical protein